MRLVFGARDRRRARTRGQRGRLPDRRGDRPRRPGRRHGRPPRRRGRERHRVGSAARRRHVGEPAAGVDRGCQPRGLREVADRLVVARDGHHPHRGNAGERRDAAHRARRRLARLHVPRRHPASRHHGPQPRRRARARRQDHRGRSRGAPDAIGDHPRVGHRRDASTSTSIPWSSRSAISSSSAPTASPTWCTRTPSRPSSAARATRSVPRRGSSTPRTARAASTTSPSW